MTEPKYIAVVRRTGSPSIIKRCDDKGCDKWHEWVTINGGRYYEASVIARAMNEAGSWPTLTNDDIEKAILDSGVTISDRELQLITSAVGAAFDRRTSSDSGAAS